MTITDDDALPTVNLPSGFLIANEGDGSLTVTVSLSAASGREVSVSYASSDLSGSNAATAGQDYGAVERDVAVRAGVDDADVQRFDHGRHAGRGALGRVQPDVERACERGAGVAESEKDAHQRRRRRADAEPEPHGGRGGGGVRGHVHGGAVGGKLPSGEPHLGDVERDGGCAGGLHVLERSGAATDPAR